MTQEEYHNDMMEQFREMGRMQGREMLRKIHERTVLDHLEGLQHNHPGQYYKGYIDGIMYALKTLGIKP
jgi:hypothetical protein